MSISSRIEYVQTNDLLDEPVPVSRAPSPGLGTRRRIAGAVLAAVGLPLLTLLLDSTRGTLSLEGQVLLYLLAVVVVGLVGGVAVSVPTAVAAALLINYFFVEPLHTLHIAQGDQALSLAIFVVVAAVVSGAVEIAARRARAAEQAGSEAETLSALAGGAGLDDTETLRGVLDRALESFNMESVVLKARQRETGDWVNVERAGWGPPGAEAPLQFDVPINANLRLIGRGPALYAEDQRVLLAFAAAAETAYEGRVLGERAREGRELANVDRQRTALLAAVGHDLRTPLAGIKAAVSTLRQTDVRWSDAEREELLAAIEQSSDRLEAIVANLLDASRLQAGMVSVMAEPIALDEVIGAAVLGVAGADERVEVDVPESLPLVQADAGLLERVLVNLLDNAVRYGGDGEVQVTAWAGAESAKLEVVDHGPGVTAEQRERLFAPFQQLGDHSTVSGVGLGLTVARGFVEAMGGALVADGSSGGGLTMRLRLPLAKDGAAAPRHS
jgi:two-component system sensor histidine kinase KdpD